MDCACVGARDEGRAGPGRAGAGRGAARKGRTRVPRARSALPPPPPPAPPLPCRPQPLPSRQTRQHANWATNQSTKRDNHSAAYKQATTGDCKGSAPSKWTNPSGAYKFEAWEKLKGMSKQDAMREYVAALQAMDPRFTPPAAASNSHSAAPPPKLPVQLPATAPTHSGSKAPRRNPSSAANLSAILMNGGGGAGAASAYSGDSATGLANGNGLRRPAQTPSTSTPGMRRNLASQTNLGSLLAPPGMRHTPSMTGLAGLGAASAGGGGGGGGGGGLGGVGGSGVPRSVSMSSFGSIGQALHSAHNLHVSSAALVDIVEDPEPLFRAAVEHMRQHMEDDLDNETTLELYGLYQQATKGDCKLEPPSHFAIVERAKWAAWDECRGMTKSSAMRGYARTIQLIDPEFQPSIAPSGRVMPSRSSQMLAQSSSKGSMPSSASGMALGASGERPIPPTLDEGEEEEEEEDGGDGEDFGVGTGVQLDREQPQPPAPAPLPLPDVHAAHPVAIPPTDTTALGADFESLPPPRVAINGETGVPLTVGPPAASGPSGSRSLWRRLFDPENSLFLMVLAAAGSMIGLGFMGFLMSTLTMTQMAWLGLMMTGFMALFGALLTQLEEHGLVSILPDTVREWLFDTTLLEFLLDDRMFRNLRELGTNLIPLFLASTEEQQLEALSHMSLSMRRTLTTKGMVNIMPDRWQRWLLPRRLYEIRQEQSQSAQFRLSRAAKDVERLNRLVRDDSSSANLHPHHFAAEQGAIHMQRRLMNRLLGEVVSKTNMEIVVRLINPDRARMGAIFMSLLMVLQLALSSKAREVSVHHHNLADISFCVCVCVCDMDWSGAESRTYNHPATSATSQIVMTFMRTMMLLGTGMGASMSLGGYMLYHSANNYLKAKASLMRDVAGELDEEDSPDVDPSREFMAPIADEEEAP